MKHGELIAIGGAYVDINVPGFPINEGGLQLETEVVGGDYLVELGGSAVNFARLCSSLNTPTTFVGKVGEDTFGNTFVDLLQKARVHPAVITSSEVSTCISFNMIAPDGRSAMTVAGTANKSLGATEVYDRVSQLLPGSAYLYLGGCFKLKELMPAFVQLATEAQSAGAKVVLDHGRLNNSVTEDDKKIMRSLAMVADFYLPSVDEFIQLWNVSSLEEGLRLMQREDRGTTVVKNSQKGAVTMADDKLVTVPAYPVKPIHSIGAGDSFNAGFIAAQHRKQDLLASVAFGCATAALKISQDTLPTFEDVAALVARR